MALMSSSCSIRHKAGLKNIYISGAKQVEVKTRKAVLIYFPFRVFKVVKKTQGRLMRELERKLSKKHVVFVANRITLDKNFQLAMTAECSHEAGGLLSRRCRWRDAPLASRQPGARSVGAMPSWSLARGCLALWCLQQAPITGREQR